MKDIFIYSDFVDNPRFRYVLDNINFHPYFSDQIRLIPTTEEEKAEIIYARTIDADKDSILRIPVEACFLNKEMLEAGVDNIRFSSTNLDFDIFDFLFFNWSMFQERYYPSTLRSSIDTMPESMLWSVKTSYHQERYLDELLARLAKRLLSSWTKPTTPENIVTADIDYLSYNELSFMSRLKIFLSAFKRSDRRFVTLGHIDKFFSDDEILFHWLENHKPSMVFILVGGSHTFDFNKKGIFQNNIIRVISKIKELDISIGVHPSFDCASDLKMLKEQKQYLELLVDRPIKDSRMHYLHFDPDMTVSHLEAVGIVNDFTCGLNDHVGYKIGTRFPFYYYHWAEERKSKLVSHPFVWMDSSQWSASKKNIKRYLDDVKSMKENKLQGILVFHPHMQFYLQQLY
jgi:hypothetical protein